MNDQIINTIIGQSPTIATLVFFIYFLIKEKKQTQTEQSKLEESYRNMLTEHIAVLTKIVENNNSVIAAHNDIHKEFIVAMNSFQKAMEENRQLLKPIT